MEREKEMKLSELAKVEIIKRRALKKKALSSQSLAYSVLELIDELSFPIGRFSPAPLLSAFSDSMCTILAIAETLRPGVCDDEEAFKGIASDPVEEAEYPLENLGGVYTELFQRFGYLAGDIVSERESKEEEVLSGLVASYYFVEAAAENFYREWRRDNPNHDDQESFRRWVLEAKKEMYRGVEERKRKVRERKAKEGEDD